jgi:BirA family biotin operon repressor/biotin-[acetyl-CoA-carboxylase] ligase
MRLLADCPERLAGWIPSDEDWLACEQASLPAEERRLWQTLAGNSTPWLLPSADWAGSFWHSLVVIGKASGSQFDAVNELLRTGAVPTEPLACLALEGQGFHGLHGRPWAAVRGNLHLTAALQPGNLPVAEAIALTALPAVAAAEAIRSVSGGALRAGIKWVNDILIEDRKVAGVITSTKVLGQNLTQVVLGIGINVAASPAVAPTPFVPRVGCLSDFGLHASLREVLGPLLAGIGQLYLSLLREGRKPILDAYRSLSTIIGREVCVFEDPIDAEGPNGPSSGVLIARGIVNDLGPDLALHIEGRRDPVTRGRLAFVEHVTVS